MYNALLVAILHSRNDLDRYTDEHKETEQEREGRRVKEISNIQGKNFRLILVHVSTPICSLYLRVHALASVLAELLLTSISGDQITKGQR